MKAKIIPIITMLSFISIIFYSCEDSTLREYTGYAPEYLSYKDLRTAVTEVQNVDLKNAGKIYFKDNYIFIVEELEGIHIFDNTNPASPIKKAFDVVFPAQPGNDAVADGIRPEWISF